MDYSKKIQLCLAEDSYNINIALFREYKYNCGKKVKFGKQIKSWCQYEDVSFLVKLNDLKCRLHFPHKTATSFLLHSGETYTYDVCCGMWHVAFIGRKKIKHLVI